MAYANFIESVESKKLLTERDKHLVLADHCTREWEGEIKKQGDSIVVKGLGRATIYKADKNGIYTANEIGKGSIAGSGKDVIHKGIPDPEEIEGYEKKFEVNQIALFNFMVGDIDDQQSSEKGIINKTRPKAAQDIAYQQDEHVRDVIIANKNCALAKYATKGVANAITLTSGTASGDQVNILDFIDEFVMSLRLNNVKDSEKLYAEVSPAFMRRLKTALRNIDTDNSSIVRGRKITTYNGIDFYMSNAMLKKVDDKTMEEYCFIRTGDSVAFFDPLTVIQPYKPEKGFGDALKGFNLYDAGVVDEKACLFAKIGGYVG